MLIAIVNIVFASVMPGLKRLKGKVKLFLFNREFSYLPEKQFSELLFWFRIIDKYIAWYRGMIPHLYGYPPPTEKSKVRGFGLRENAIRTWARFDKKRYLDRLLISPDYFKGMRILDIGCGPLPLALVFTKCEVFGLDQLVEYYKRIGYPLDTYSERMTYVSGRSEKIPLENNFFDAVISVNAIDHVDDFVITAKEITRVLKPKGILRFEAHYHKRTICEPLVLNDEIINKHLGHLGIVKVCSRPFTDFYPDVPERGEELVIWSNKEE